MSTSQARHYIHADSIRTQEITTSMVLLTLEPSAADIVAHLDPLSARLQDVESSLRDCRRWHAPPAPPKSPEYSIIDISDLSSAIKLLEDILAHSSSSNILPSPQSSFSKYQWTWDPVWKEFYTPIPNSSSRIYLSRWRLNEARQVWEHVSMSGLDLLPDHAAEMLGSWEDWMWDSLWKEWRLDVSTVDEGSCCVYASRWELRGDGEWVYIGEIGSLA
jgi:hypothetical protein